MRRPLALAVVLACSGCNPHHEQLLHEQAVADTRLVDAQRKAESLMVARRRLEPLREEVRRGLEEFPDLRTEAPPAAPEVTAPPLAPLPPPAMFESASESSIRRRVEETRLRIAQLEKIMAEVARLEAEEARLRAVIESIKQRRAAIK